MYFFQRLKVLADSSNVVEIKANQSMKHELILYPEDGKFFFVLLYLLMPSHTC